MGRGLLNILGFFWRWVLFQSRGWKHDGPPRILWLMWSRLDRCEIPKERMKLIWRTFWGWEKFYNLGPINKRYSSIKNEYFLLFKLFQPFGIFLWSLNDSEKEENHHGLDNRIGTHTIIPNWTIRDIPEKSVPSVTG